MNYLERLTKYAKKLDKMRANKENGLSFGKDGSVFIKTIYNIYKGKNKSETLYAYLAGLKDRDLRKFTIAGENMVEDTMDISIFDLAGWIRSGVNFRLKMPKKDLKLIKDYFTKGNQ